MKNYFVPDLTPKQKQKLQEAAVAFCDLEIDGMGGLVVDQDNITRTMEILGAAIESEVATSLEGIVKISLNEGVPHPIIVANWNGYQQDKFCAIAQDILLPAVKRDIIFHVPHGGIVAPASDGKFHIFVWSAPVGQREDFQAPEKIWGIGVDCRDSGFRASGQGAPIVDAETGWAVGEMVGNNLYIHHDLCHCGRDREVKIFYRLCEEVVVELSATPEEKVERQRKLAEAKRAASRDAYIKECLKRFEKTVHGTKDAVAKGHTDIARLQQELTRRIRETQGAERKLEQIKSLRGDHFASYGREFDSLLSVPGVENVETGDGVIKVFTENIEITPDGCADTYDIGRFRMEIYTSGSKGCIRFFNMTRKGSRIVSGYGVNHPHINDAGEPCLGNIKEMVPALIGEAEYSAVAQIGLQYLKSVNTDDSAGRGIFDNWPKKEKEDVNGYG